MCETGSCSGGRNAEGKNVLKLCPEYGRLERQVSTILGQVVEERGPRLSSLTDLREAITFIYSRELCYRNRFSENQGFTLLVYWQSYFCI